MNSKQSALGALGALVCALMLFAAPAAFAQAVQHGYAGPAGDIQQQIGRDAPAPPHTASGDDPGVSLPFTGLDLGLVGIAGCFLVVAGFAARRISNSLLP